MEKEKATYYCVDIECSGQVPAIYDMISLGIVVVRQVGAEYEIGEDLYVEIAPVSDKVDEHAMKVNGLDIEKLRINGLSRKEALKMINDFVERTKVPNTEAVFVGHNAPFDWSFVVYSYVAENVYNPFGYKAFCTKAFSAGVLGLHWLDSNKEVLAKILNLPQEDKIQKHRADYDARYQALILKSLLEYEK